MSRLVSLVFCIFVAISVISCSHLQLYENSACSGTPDTDVSSTTSLLGDTGCYAYNGGSAEIVCSESGGSTTYSEKLWNVAGCSGTASQAVYITGPTYTCLPAGTLSGTQIYGKIECDSAAAIAISAFSIILPIVLMVFLF